MAEHEDKSPSRSWLAIMLVACLTLVLLTALVFITMGWLGLVLIMGAGIFALAALHYLVWGWWLSRVLRDQEEAEANPPDSSRTPSGRGS